MIIKTLRTITEAKTETQKRNCNSIGNRLLVITESKLYQKYFVVNSNGNISNNGKTLCIGHTQCLHKYSPSIIHSLIR